MTWSYSPSDLATSEKDAIRLEIADTDQNNQLLQDEEIVWAISQERNFWAAAARCCEMVSRDRLNKADVRLGRNMQVQYSKTAEQYYNMAKDLRRKAMGTVPPYVGGMNVADKQAIQTDTSLVAPAFARDMQENPWVGGYTADIGGVVASDADDDENL